MFSKAFFLMELCVGRTVLYSVTLDGDRVGTTFTSCGEITDLSPTHVSLKIPMYSNFPYKVDTLPVVHRTPKHDLKADSVTDIKIPRLYVRSVYPKGKLPTKEVLSGLFAKNSQLVYTMWSNDKYDYVFRTLCFDFRGLGPYANPNLIVVSDIPVKNTIKFTENVTVEPLNVDDLANSLILKQQPKALLLTEVNHDYVVPITCIEWDVQQLRNYIATEIKSDLIKIGAFDFTLIKVTKKSEMGYYAFTETDQYIDTRSFRGTVYIDQETGEFKVSSFDEETRRNDDNNRFFRAPYLKVGYSVFLSDETHVSETKTMTSFYNMSLCINNLMILLEHGKEHPIFQNKTDQVVRLMDNPDCPGSYMQNLALFWLDPLSTKQNIVKMRRKYLWWL